MGSLVCSAAAMHMPGRGKGAQAPGLPGLTGAWGGRACSTQQPGIRLAETALQQPPSEVAIAQGNNKAHIRRARPCLYSVHGLLCFSGLQFHPQAKMKAGNALGKSLFSSTSDLARFQLCTVTATCCMLPKVKHNSVTSDEAWCHHGCRWISLALESY